jgi:hypothetical protein
MQKVVGSSPIIRSPKVPLRRVFVSRRGDEENLVQPDLQPRSSQKAKAAKLAKIDKDIERVESELLAAKKAAAIEALEKEFASA